jgi:alkaline phosphatase D
MSATRRRFLQAATAFAAGPRFLKADAQAPAVIPAERTRPVITHGVMSGDVAGGSAVIWSRTDRPARMIVEYSTSESFQDATRLLGPHCLDVTDYTGRILVDNLPAGADIFYRVIFQSAADGKTESEPVTGRFKTVGSGDRQIRFVWGGGKDGASIPTSAA